MRFMRNIVPVIFVLLLVVSGCSRKHPQVITQKLVSEWQFKMAADTVWHPAKVPGTVQTDLLMNKLIPDPFYGTNESKLQWIGKENWIYKTRFDVADNIFNKKHIELIFNGLDTYAEVRLNGKLILNADNMFRTWKVDCKKILRKKGNTLTILFRSPLKVNKARFEHMPYRLPADNDRSNIKVSVFTRKASYQFGWDWAPRFVTSGIWRPVEITAWDNAKINDLQIYQQNVSDSLAVLKAVTEVRSETVHSAVIQLFSNDSLLKEKRFNLKKGENYLALEFQIQNPRLWWTNGLGEAYLYRFSVRLLQQGRMLDKKSTRFGIRTLEIVQKPDSAGRSFYVKLNGVPVYMKGANYIPQDNFLPRVSKQKYKALILAAKNAHMNMLRVWGGGTYENNEFYDLSDENGILVWQDFMFAGSLYPGDTAFLNNVKQEAIDNVKRLRNHPSLALWVGNNEIQVAWERWGYQKKYHYSKADSTKIYRDYLKLFHQLLPDVVKTYDPGRFYRPSSPNSAPKGWDQEARTGDMHYWGVWWGRLPFTAYESHVGRFVSEFGFQSLPAYSTIAEFAPDSSRYLVSPIMRAHNKSPDGYAIIDQYMRRNFRVPKSFRQYILVSQLLQAEGMKIAIEAQRRARPYSMGSLYWQLDDVWPGVTWSGIDYFGRWKALQYYLRKLFAPVLVSPVYKNGKLNLYLVSDLLRSKDVALKITLMDFYGKQLWQKRKKVRMMANASKIVFSTAFKNTLKPYDKNKVFLHVEIRQNDSLLAEDNLFFARTKDLVLPKPHLQYKTKTENGHFIVIITSKVFVKYVVLNYPDDKGIFSDNYFALLPGRSKTIRINLKNAENEFYKRIKIKSLY
ncbi:MAG: beta-mannosidase [bacterium]|nr:MAG: beta-mannosidase [bacterium]